MRARRRGALRRPPAWISAASLVLASCATDRVEVRRGARPGASAFNCVLPCVSARVGVPTLLAVEPADPALQYRFLTKLNDLSWDWSAPWQDDAGYEFCPLIPGLYAIQVDVRDRTSREVVWQKWLGQIEVFGPLVLGVARVPLSQALPVGTPIDFVVQLADVPLEWLEFRVWDLLPVNTIVTDWRSWPLPPYLCDGPRHTALQVDVRLAAAPQIMERYWLGDVITHERTSESPANLVRNLASDDFDVFDNVAAQSILAGELWLATRMLVWEFDGVPVSEQLDRLRAACEVRLVDESPDGGCVVAGPGRTYDVDLTARTLAQRESPVRVTVDLAHYPRYAEALRSLESVAPAARPVGLLVLAIYEGFRYGTPAGHVLGSVADVRSHCGTQAQLLQDLLSAWGVESEVVAITVPAAVGPPAFHAVVQVRPDGDPLLLDASAGYVYRCGADALMELAAPEPILLPQCRDLSELDLRLLTSFDMEVAVAPRGVPGVVPLTVRTPRGPDLPPAATQEASTAP